MAEKTVVLQIKVPVETWKKIEEVCALFADGEERPEVYTPERVVLGAFELLYQMQLAEREEVVQ